MPTSNQEDQSETIAFLSRPENLSAKSPPQQINTHGAIIFLTDDRGFKLKRAVDYGYLDFSTVEKRRQACEAELRLNRRTAPDLYLEVRSINRDTEGNLSFDTAGQTVDWVVVMRRFADQNLFETLAEQNKLTPHLMRNLADHIAEFHESAEVFEGSNGTDKARSVIDGNRHSMQAIDPDILSPADVEQLYDRSIAELTAVSGKLERRAGRGCIRHCHGDLHLGNICLWKDEPTLFDCLEFNDELATTDVLYDIAFLLMDLWQRDLTALASLVFNRYLDIRPESDGIAALPLFMSMRAAVRAHVSATAAASQPSKAATSAKQQQSKHYLTAAMSFLDKSEPKLIAVGGLSGTGKSTLAGALAPDIGHAPGARWLRTDVLRKRMFGAMPETRLEAEAYTPEVNEAVYQQLEQEALSILSDGHTVILDGVFAKPDERNALAGLARSANVAFQGFWLDAPAETLVERVTNRLNDASDADKDIVLRQLDYKIGELGTGWDKVAADGTPEMVLANARSLIR